MQSILIKIFNIFKFTFIKLLNRLLAQRFLVKRETAQIVC